MKRPEKRFLGVGVGMREKHYQQFLMGEVAPAQWVEVNCERYLERDARGYDNHLQVLKLVREKMPVILHGTSMSLGSVHHDNTPYLNKLADLVNIIEPEFVSDHFCWSAVNGIATHDLLPLPFTQESIDTIVPRILRAQDTLKRHLVLENLSSYFEFQHSEMSEAEFLSEIMRQADCYMLLDINNVFVCSSNFKRDAKHFLSHIPHERVVQIHLAGHTDRGDLLIDTHSKFTVDPVWDLFRWYTENYGPVSTMIEWDTQIPDWPVLARELKKIESVLTASQGKVKCA